MMGRDEKSVDPHQPEIEELWEHDVSKVPVFSRAVWTMCRMDHVPYGPCAV